MRKCLQCATWNAAKMLRLDDQIGAIEPGKIADIIVVKGDPLHDISVMSDIKMVMQKWDDSG